MITKTCIALLCLLLALFTSSAFAQSHTTGRIAGTVKDQRGDLIAGAEVTVSSKTTAEERKVTTDNEANYSVSLLPPGTYSVRITANGFHPTVFDPVRVVITETITVDAELRLGEIGDIGTVEIAQLVQRDGPQLGRVVDTRAVSELPLATRNFLQILALSPGTSVSLPNNTALGRNSQNVSVNGARVTQNDFEINGIDANNITTNAAPGVAVPAPETIQEFKVQTSLYPASFGRGGGGNVQAITKSGSNNFHGAGYEYFRDDVFNANNPFLKAASVSRPILQRNVFGGLLGGPIKANKMFFFLSYQGTREVNGASPNSLTTGVLIAAGLSDDRSQQTLLTTFRPRPSPGAPPSTSINPAALALLNARLPNGQFLIPTPQADGHYSGSALSSIARINSTPTSTTVSAIRTGWPCGFSSPTRHIFLRCRVAAQMFRALVQIKTRTTGCSRFRTFTRSVPGPSTRRARAIALFAATRLGKRR